MAASRGHTLRNIAVATAMLWLYTLYISAQSFTIVSYNVENLFYPANDPHTQDDEFTPTSGRRWTMARFHRKLHNIGKAIVACDSVELPALVALCEVEDDSAMAALTRISPLRTAGYRYVMTTAERGSRGINVALMYQRDRFRYISHAQHRIPKNRNTRPILHVVGSLITGDTLDIFVVHFPSRSGGEKRSEPQRIAAATRLKQLSDSIQRIRQHAYIIAMGDFNDYSNNRSLQLLTRSPHPLRNLMPPVNKQQLGSYKYNGDWGNIDHILVSPSLLNRHSPLIPTADRQARIATFPFLMEKDTKYLGIRPFRTYYGYTYRSTGTSDHLPILLKMRLRQ